MSCPVIKSLDVIELTEEGLVRQFAYGIVCLLEIDQTFPDFETVFIEVEKKISKIPEML